MNDGLWEAVQTVAVRHFSGRRHRLEKKFADTNFEGNGNHYLLEE
jgi:hypothetical protein